MTRFGSLSMLLASTLIAASPAKAADHLKIVDSYIRYQSDDGSEFSRTTAIPYAVERSCYSWVIEFEPDQGQMEIDEQLILPSAAPNWGLLPGDGVIVSADNASAVTPRLIDLSEGIASYGWCVAAGDPVGNYQFVLRAGATVLAALPFNLVAPTRKVEN